MKWLPILLTVFLMGCVGHDFDLNKVDQVKTKQEALDMLGKPTGKSKVAGTGQETWTYTHGTPFGAKAAHISFDKDGNVIQHATNKSK